MLIQFRALKYKLKIKDCEEGKHILQFQVHCAEFGTPKQFVVDDPKQEYELKEYGDKIAVLDKKYYFMN